MALDHLTKWDFPNKTWEPDGYNMTEVLVVSDENFRKLVNEHNKLIDVINELCDHLNIDPADIAHNDIVE